MTCARAQVQWIKNKCEHVGEKKSAADAPVEPLMITNRLLLAAASGYLWNCCPYLCAVQYTWHRNGPLKLEIFNRSEWIFEPPINFTWLSGSFLFVYLLLADFISMHFYSIILKISHPMRTKKPSFDFCL